MTARELVAKAEELRSAYQEWCFERGYNVRNHLLNVVLDSGDKYISMFAYDESDDGRVTEKILDVGQSCKGDYQSYKE